MAMMIPDYIQREMEYGGLRIIDARSFPDRLGILLTLVDRNGHIMYREVDDREIYKNSHQNRWEQMYQAQFYDPGTQISPPITPSKKAKCKSCLGEDHESKLDWRERCSKTLEKLNVNRQKLHSHRLAEQNKLTIK